MALRDQILALLAQPQTDPRFSESYFVRSAAQTVGCQRGEVIETLWGLVGDGLVYLDPSGQGSGTDNWRWKVSAVGLRVIEGGAWEPQDMAGYLRRLRHSAPPLDDAVLTYVEEALRAFNARCYLSAVVMIGVASERSFLGLASVVARAVGPQAAKLAKVLDRRNASQHERFTELRKVLESRRSQLPSDLVDQLTLDAVAELLRVVRNDAGHPTGAAIDEDTARTQLHIAGPYLVKMAKLESHVGALAVGTLITGSSPREPAS